MPCRRLALPLAGLLALAALPVRAQAPAIPDVLIDAVRQGYDIVAVVGQGAGARDHVIYLKKDRDLLVCGFRFVLTDDGFDPKQSRPLGVCTPFR
jgi:hypothetical protein